MENLVGLIEQDQHQSTMWKLFKNEKEKPKVQKNRIDELANKLHREGKIQELEKELLEIHPAKLAGNELESWHRFYGIVAFNRNDHKVAFERFKSGLEACPSSSFLSFSLGQEYEHFGKPVEMFELFDRTKFPDIPASILLAEARYAYLWNRPDKAESYLRPVLEACYKLGIADDTFLYMRGLPFFSETWAYLGLFFILQNNFEAFRAFTEQASQKLSDCDFTFHKMELECFASNDFSPLKNQLGSRIEAAKPKNFPTTYDEMRVAILRAQLCADAQDAEAELNSVQLTPKDFKWLEDIRLLARCELAHRSKNEASETALQAEFFSKQPLLFEPSHVLNFNLWRYQEKLKARYQNRKRANGNEL